MPSDSTRITDWGALTNLGPNLEVQNVTLSNGRPRPRISGSFPSTVANGDAITGTGIPSGTTVTSVSGGTLALSQAPTGGTVTVRITTASALAVGQGVPIGVPIRVMGVNTASGTESTFASYANSGVTSVGAASNMDNNAASDPNPATDTGTNTTPHIALENNSDQIDQFANGGLPVTGLRRPGHRGGDDPVHRVQRRLQHQPVRRRLDDQRHLVPGQRLRRTVCRRQS